MVSTSQGDDNGMLNASEPFDSEAEYLKLLNMIETKSSHFVMGGKQHTYNHLEPIFLLAEPIQRDEKKTRKVNCRCCLYEFKDPKEWTWCEFCGYNIDEKCIRKTRFFPKDMERDLEKKRRGVICKVCDRKFLVHKKVAEIYNHINAAKKINDDSISKLGKQGNAANDEFKSGETGNASVTDNINKIDEEVEAMKKEIKKIKNERKTKKINNTSILEHKEKMESEVHKA